MLPIAAVQLWEDLGQQLEKTLATYLDACITLETLNLNGSSAVNDLFVRIHQRLASFHFLLSRPLALSRSSITRARNNLIAPACRLPDEILSEILSLTLYSITINEPRQLPYKDAVRLHYQRLHSFLGVCSTWRRVAIASGRFWSLVPLIENLSNRLVLNAARLSIERASNHRLCLAAQLGKFRPDIQDFIGTTFSQQGPRFHSINLYSESVKPIRQALALIVNTDQNRPIESLSLYRANSIDGIINPPPGQLELVKLFPGRPSSSKIFKIFTQSLRVLRVCGMSFPFEGVPLSSLTELRLQNLSLGENYALPIFLQGLGSAYQLRTLELITVLTNPDGGGLFNDIEVIIPNLKHLYLEDLNHDSLKFILRSVTPGSHTVTVNWTYRCWTVQEVNGSVSHPPQSLEVSHLKIDTLMLRNRTGSELSSQLIQSILEAMPSITTLYLDSFRLDLESLYGLISARIQTAQHPTMGIQELGIDPPRFPELKNLYISRSHCHDEELEVLDCLPRIAINHPLQELGIGIGVECNCGGSYIGTPSPRGDLELKMGMIWSSLENLVPRVIRLAEKASEMPPITELESHIWSLCDY
ncbi:unnamed protein product [Rhizoctonia solani]|uniref:F-box domain-containing protein n=1 Tax=Rhizoctonia solani TaxID=456999 RepID=A0A8H3GX80_9AGAM|nr:unnamed protein product [Rhizoctonia solani]CAE7062429.1 unnamed protein product [Rhizoctonia solani]